MTGTRYTLGGDEHLFVELSESMSLRAFFRGILITQELAARDLDGVTEICPANASFQVRFDPDVLDVGRLQGILEEIDARGRRGARDPEHPGDRDPRALQRPVDP